MIPSLRLVFWETTKACNLTCRHCRAVPQRRVGPAELTPSEAFNLIDAIARVSKPVMVAPERTVVWLKKKSSAVSVSTLFALGGRDSAPSLPSGLPVFTTTWGPCAAA